MRDACLRAFGPQQGSKDTKLQIEKQNKICFKKMLILIPRRMLYFNMMPQMFLKTVFLKDCLETDLISAVISSLYVVRELVGIPPYLQEPS